MSIVSVFQGCKNKGSGQCGPTGVYLDVHPALPHLLLTPFLTKVL